MAAKRFIKDMKVLRKVDPKRFPAITHVLADFVIEEIPVELSEDQIIQLLIGHISKAAEDEKRYAFDANRSFAEDRSFLEESFLMKSLDDIEESIDDRANAIVKKLQGLGVEEDDILELMLECIGSKFSVWPEPVPPNTLVGDSLPEWVEFEVDQDDFIRLDTGDEVTVASLIDDLKYKKKMWFPQFVKKISAPTDYVLPPGQVQDLWNFEVMHGQVNVRGRRLELVLDVPKFAIAAKRFVKDAKVLRKIDPDRFPATSRLFNN
jgi:DNA-binding transcriptional regulator YhcF (GntR family)